MKRKQHGVTVKRILGYLRKRVRRMKREYCAAYTVQEFDYLIKWIAAGMPKPKRKKSK